LVRSRRRGRKEEGWREGGVVVVSLEGDGRSRAAVWGRRMGRGEREREGGREGGRAGGREGGREGRTSELLLGVESLIFELSSLGRC